MTVSRLPPRRALCLFCGASDKFPGSFNDAAAALGAGCAANGWRLVYGGSRSGLMGRAARAAMAGGGEVVGIRPGGFLSAEMPAGEISEMIQVDTFFERKRLMATLSDHFVALPGGLGTLDEVTDVMNLAVARTHSKRTYLLDVDGYWQPLLRLFEHFDAFGATRPGFADSFAVVPDVAALFALLGRAEA